MQIEQYHCIMAMLEKKWINEIAAIFNRNWLFSWDDIHAPRVAIF